MARTKRKTEEFEVKKDYIPDFLEALGELAELCAKENDFRATSFRRAIVALEGQIITAVEDIKLLKLAELKGVGKSTLEMLTEFIETGKIERLEEMRPEEKATPDQVEWFSSLTKEQAGYIQDWWDETGERKCCVGNGIPFTFEHDGKKYKVDGDADDIEQEGACIGVHFDGAIYKNGVKYGTVVLNWEVDTFEHDGTYCRITLVDEDNVEELSGLEETCLEEFPDFYEFPDNMAYRE